jgi:hypothetical protein
MSSTTDVNLGKQSQRTFVVGAIEGADEGDI